MMQLLKRVDPTVPIEHTVGALAELVKLGDSFSDCTL
jgi:aryl-alcohol dehydrogenase-like predicted oxidoreductase